VRTFPGWTAGGFDLQTATNYFGPFVLASLPDTTTN